MVHECVIGLLQKWDDRVLVTLEDLEEEIDKNIKYSESCWARHGYRNHVFTLKEYGDRRKNTDLTRFYFCPECGEKIDWLTIRRIGNGQI